MKKLTINDWLLVAGLALIVLINPLVGQYVIQGIIFAYEQLLLVSDYAMLIGLTMIAISFLLSKIERRKKNTAKFKKLAGKKTKSAGDYLLQ